MTPVFLRQLSRRFHVLLLTTLAIAVALTQYRFVGNGLLLWLQIAQAAEPSPATTAPPNPAPASDGGTAVPGPAPGTATLEELQQLVSPIALYPDTLIAQMLAASTYPTQIVEAQ